MGREPTYSEGVGCDRRDGTTTFLKRNDGSV